MRTLSNWNTRLSKSSSGRKASQLILNKIGSGFSFTQQTIASSINFTERGKAHTARCFDLCGGRTIVWGSKEKVSAFVSFKKQKLISASIGEVFRMVKISRFSGNSLYLEKAKNSYNCTFGIYLLSLNNWNLKILAFSTLRCIMVTSKLSSL